MTLPTHARHFWLIRGLHWLMAAMLLAQIGFAFYLQSLPFSPQKMQYFSWHKWAGVTLFALVAVRLAVRLLRPGPPLPASMSKLSRLLAHAGHATLYLLMFAIPLTGWVMSSAKGFQTVWFGVLPLPDLVGRDRALGNLLADVHGVLCLLLLAVVAGHVAAALKHRWIDRDGVFERMSFGASRSVPPRSELSS